MAPVQVQVRVEVYVEGKGPPHVFDAPLQGWDENRLDLEAIMSTYGLRRLYAFSLPQGQRGNRLLFNPRNGLSVIAYSGNPNTVIRLDGDPKESYMWMICKVLSGLVLICGLAFFALSDALPESVEHLRVLGGGNLVWLTCFVAILYSQLVWRPLKKRR